MNPSTPGSAFRVFRDFFPRFPRSLLTLLILAFPVFLFPQIPRYSCAVTHISPQSRTLAVRCQASSSDRRVEIVFRDRFAGMTGLGSRISSLEVSGKNGSPDPSSPLVFTYQVNLAAPLDPGGYALVSSLGSEAAVFYAADLFPVLQGPGDRAFHVTRVLIAPPEGWRMATTGGEDVDDPDAAVYVLGRLRERSFETGSMKWRVVTAGDVSVADAEIHRLAEAIARAQAAMIDGRETGEHLLAVAPFPLPLTGLRSTGLARGRTVALLLNPGSDAGQTRRHLARHLAHEMFHFYLPNAFKIRENFDWFWEGFTRYLALVALLDAREISVQDYLDALQNEYEAYQANPLRAKVSLLAASPEKFSSPAHYEIVYRKGLIVGALYDLELRRQSQARRRLPDVVLKLYRDYARAGREIGNREILDALGREGDFARFIADYVEGVREIDLARQLRSCGIEVERRIIGGQFAGMRLIVSPRLNARQRAVIASFGGR